MYGIFEPEENLPSWTGCSSIVARCLDTELYKKLFYNKTTTGYTLDKAIQIAVDVKDTEIGFMLGDYECIEVFEPLIERIINNCQPFFNYSNSSISHRSNFAKLNFNGSQLLKDFVLHYSFHLRRNLRGYSLPPHCTRAERREVNRILVYILEQMKFDESLKFLQYAHKDYQSKNITSNKSKKGICNNLQASNSSNANGSKKNSKYKSKASTSSMPKSNVLSVACVSNAFENDSKNEIGDEDEYNNNRSKSANICEDNKIVDLVQIDDGTLTELEELGLAPPRELSLSDEYLISGLSRDFPDGRTLFYNRKAMVGAWTNHENHLEMVIQHSVPDLKYIYMKFVDIYHQMRRILRKKEMAWIRHRRLGMLTTSPKHFGSGLSIRCSVRCPMLMQHPKYEHILYERHLEIAAHTEDIATLETLHTLGRSELQMAKQLGESLVDLAKMEKLLAKNKSIDNMIKYTL